MIQVTTIPGKRLGVRRTVDFVTFDHVASDILGTGETVEVRDEGATLRSDYSYYVVVVEGDL